jgi:hypothetical protein
MAVNKKTVMAALLISAFLILPILVMRVNLAKADNPMAPPDLPTPIYIMENGTIQGADGAIEQNGNIYTFVRDINNTIEVQKDNIIIDGAGHTLAKPPEAKTDGYLVPAAISFGNYHQFLV